MSTLSTEKQIDAPSDAENKTGTPGNYNVEQDIETGILSILT